MMYQQRFKNVDIGGSEHEQELSISIEAENKPVLLTDYAGGTAIFSGGAAGGQVFSLARNDHPLGLKFLREKENPAILKALTMPHAAPIQKPLQMGDTLTLTHDDGARSYYRAF